MHKPASKAAAHVCLGRLEEHKLALDVVLVAELIVGLAVASNEDNLVVFTVWICWQTLLFCATFLGFPVLDKLPDLGFEIHEQALGTSRALQLLA